MGIKYNTSIVRDGLVLHLDAANPKSYPGSGTVWKDLSGNGNDGTLVNSPELLNNGFRFSNDSSWIAGGFSYIENSSTLSDISTFTLSFCIYSLGTQSNNGASVFHKATEGSLGFVCEPINNSIRVNYWNGSAWSWSSNTVSLEHNEFIIYDYVYTGTDLIVYKNSQEVLNNPVTIVWDATNIVRVGRRRGHLQHHLYGSIFYERLYNRALTPEEIQQNFDALRGRYGI